MKIKASYLYQLSQAKKSLLLYYGIILSIYILFGGIKTYVSLTSSGTFSDSLSFTDTSTSIFFFVVGIASIKENLNYLNQNGVSRRSFLYGSILTYLTLSVITAAADTIIYGVAKQVLGHIQGIESSSIFEIIYANGNMTSIKDYLGQLLFLLTLYIGCSFCGFFTGLLYNRMSKLLRTLVSIAVPTFFILGLPLLLASGQSNSVVGEFLGTYVLGFVKYIGASPVHFFYVGILASIILGVFSALLSRRAAIK